MPDILATTEGYRADGSIDPVSVNRNQDAIQKAINKTNPGNLNGVGGRVIIPAGWGAVRGDFDMPTGCVVHLEDGATLNVGNQCNPTAMFRSHMWSGPGDTPNASRWAVEGGVIDLRNNQQGVRITDAEFGKDTNVIMSPTHQWSINERLNGSGVQPDTWVIAVTLDTKPYRAVTNQPFVQSLAPATVYCGVDHPMYGIYAVTNPRTSVGAAGDRDFDPKGRINNVEIRNTRDGGIFGYGRSGLRIFQVEVFICLGIAYVFSFDTQAVECYADYPLWGGFDIRGSSCQLGICKAFNAGQIPTFGAKPDLGFGYRVPGFYSFITIGNSDAQQNTGTNFDIARTNGVTLTGVTSSTPGFLAPKDVNGISGAYGYNLDGARNAAIVGTNGSPVGTPAIRLSGGATGNKLMITNAGPGPMFSQDSVLTGNTIV